MKKGMFITFEGGEGTGKTSQIKKINEYLNDKGIDCILTREPGGINISEQIREVILNTKNTDMDYKTEALLYAAARRQHMVERVIPAINEGKVVLCDRFLDSSLVYQGYTRGLGIEEVLDLNQYVIEDYMPDLTIYLDIDPEKGLERISKNKGREVNRLDLEDIDFHNKVREGYKKLLSMYSDRIEEVDASASLEEVYKEIKNIIVKKLNISI